MYALEREPEQGRRWRILTASAVLGAVLYASALNGAARLTITRSQPEPDHIQIKVLPPAKPAPKPAPPDPLPNPPTPKPKRSPTRDTKIQPMPKAPAPNPPPPQAPPPLVVGLTLSSITENGNGPRFALGNTPLGTVEGVARRGADIPSIPGASASPHSSATNVPVSPNRDLPRQPASLVRSNRPRYPSAAKAQGIEGVVILSITIDARGRVESASVLKGLGYGLDESALEAAKHTVWSPATLDGKAVSSTRRFNVRFTLRD